MIPTSNSVKNLMLKNVVKVSANTSVSEAISHMIKNSIGAIMITDQNIPIGIYTERDFLYKHNYLLKHGFDTQIKDIMTKNPTHVEENHSYLDALGIMRKLKIRHLPVVKGGVLVGIVGLRDLLEHYEKNLKEEIRTKDEVLQELGQTYQALNEFKSRLSHASKMVSMGELGAGVAHEMNQPLMGINAQLIIMEDNAVIQADIGLKNKVAFIRNQFKRLSSIVQRLTSYSKKRLETKMMVNSSAPIQDSIYLFQQQLKDHNIALQTDLEENISILMDSFQIQDVVLNFLVNSRDAIDAKFNQEPGGRICVFSTKIDNANALLVAIIDNGIAIPENAKEKLFNAFFTTKDADKGTGLGLSVSLNIMLNHGGLMHFAEHNNCKVFYYALPLHPDKESKLAKNSDVLIKDVLLQKLDAFSQAV